MFKILGSLAKYYFRLILAFKDTITYGYRYLPWKWKFEKFIEVVFVAYFFNFLQFLFYSVRENPRPQMREQHASRRETSRNSLLLRLQGAPEWGVLTKPQLWKLPFWWQFGWMVAVKNSWEHQPAGVKLTYLLSKGTDFGKSLTIAGLIIIWFYLLYSKSVKNCKNTLYSINICFAI